MHALKLMFTWKSSTCYLAEKVKLKNQQNFTGLHIEELSLLENCDVTCLLNIIILYCFYYSLLYYLDNVFFNTFYRPQLWDPDQGLQTHTSGQHLSQQRALPGWLVKLEESQNLPSHGPRSPQVHVVQRMNSSKNTFFSWCYRCKKGNGTVFCFRA